MVNIAHCLNWTLNELIILFIINYQHQKDYHQLANGQTPRHTAVAHGGKGGRVGGELGHGDGVTLPHDALILLDILQSPAEWVLGQWARPVDWAVNNVP